MLSENEAVKFKNKLRLWRIMHPDQDPNGGQHCSICYRLKEKGGMYCGPWYENKLRENTKTREIIELEHVISKTGGRLRCVEFIRNL